MPAETRSIQIRREIRINRVCNQNCLFCDGADFARQEVMSERKIRTSLARWASEGARELMFAGMEPTLSRKLPAYVSAAKAAGCHTVRLITNGVALSDRSRARELAEAGLDQALVSLHSHDARVSDRLTRAKGTFAKTVRAIANLLEAGVRTEVNCVVSTVNYRDVSRLFPFLDACYGTSIHAVVLSSVAPLGVAWKNKWLIPRFSCVAPHLVEALDHATARGSNVRIPNQCGLPICFLPEHEACFDELADRPRRGEDGDKMKPPQCSGCRYSMSCSGVWKRYLTLYGAAEIRAVRGRP